MSDNKYQKLGPLIGSLDQGTSSTRFLVFSAQTGELITYHQVEIKKFYPHEGWVEQAPVEIYNSCVETIEKVVEKLRDLNINSKDIQEVTKFNFDSFISSFIVFVTFILNKCINFLIYLS